MWEGVNGYLSIKRVSELFLYLEPLRIFIDDVKVGAVSSGDSKVVPLEPGKHRVRVQVDDVLIGTFPSNEMEISMEPGVVVKLECGSSFQGFRVIFSKFYFLNRTGTFYLKRADT